MSVMTTFPLYKYVLGIYSEVLGHYPPGMEVAHGLGNLVGQIQVTIYGRLARTTHESSYTAIPFYRNRGCIVISGKGGVHMDCAMHKV